MPGIGPECLTTHLGGCYSSFLARMGSCARPSISAGLWFSLVPAVFAGCRQSLLTAGPSRYYPCAPCVGAWTHTPPSPVGALALFFPTDIGLALRETRSANRNYPCPATSPGSSFSRLQSFATFRLLRSARPPDCTYRTTSRQWAAGPFTPRIAGPVTCLQLWYRYMSD